MIRFFILAIIILFSNVLYGQNNDKKWTLNDCINYALNENIDLKIKENTILTAQNSYNQSRLNVLPDVSFNAGRNVNYGDKFNVYTGSYEQGLTYGDNYSLSSSLVLFNGFYNRNTINKNKLLIIQKDNELEIAKNNLILDVLTSYLTILYSEEILKTSKEQLKMTDNLLEKTKLLVDANKIQKNKLLEIEAQIAKEKYNCLNAENELKLAYFQLFSLLNIPTADSFKIQEPDTNFLLINKSYNLDTLIDKALNINHTIKASETRVAVAEKNKQIAQSSLYPTISVFGYLTTSYSSAYTAIDYSQTPEFTGTTPTNYISESGEKIIQNNYIYNSYIVNYNNQLGDNFYNYAGISINIPIFRGGVTNTKIQNSKIEIENAKYQLEKTKNKIIEIVTKAYYEKNLAYNKFLAAQKMVEAQNSSFAISEQLYNSGKISFYDFKLSKKELFDANSELINVKYGYYFKVMILDFYIGNNFFNKE